MATQPDKKTKVRRVKNPETFREKAVRTSTEKPNKKVRGLLLERLANFFKKLFKPFKAGGVKVKQSRVGKKLSKPLRILRKILLISYFSGSFKELKGVTWPGWKQSRKLTYAVLSFAIVFGAAIASLDWVLGKIFKQILIK